MEVAREHRRNESLLLNGFCGYVKNSTGGHQTSCFICSTYPSPPSQQQPLRRHSEKLFGSHDNMSRCCAKEPRCRKLFSTFHLYRDQFQRFLLVPFKILDQLKQDLTRRCSI